MTLRYTMICWLFCFVSMTSCETKSSRDLVIQDNQHTSPHHQVQSRSGQVNQTSSTVEDHFYFSARPLMAATHAASPLVKGVLHQIQGGEEWIFKLAFNVDDALRAVYDRVVIGAFDLRLGTHRPSLIPTHYRVASSRLWWAHRGASTRTCTDAK